MPYPFQNIVALESSTAYTTIVLDFLEKRKSNALRHQFDLMFHSNSYCYIKKDETDKLDDEACLEVQRILNTRIVNDHTLLNTHYHFNFVFYLDVQNLDSERTASVLSFIKGMKRLLAAPGLQIYSYLFACKDNQNSQQAMENFDYCAKAMLESADVETPRLILVDTLPLSEADPWLRASVRALNALSCDNVFATLLRGMQKTIWNWTMTEFDVQAKEEEILKRKELEDKLTGAGEFPLGKLERNFNSLVEHTLEKHQKTLRFTAENIPIPANVVGGFFRKKVLQENIPAFAKSVEQSFFANVTKPILEGLSTANKDELIEELLKDIPLDKWADVGNNIDLVHTQEKEKPVESLDDYPMRRMSLEVQSKIEDMRTALNGELSRSVQEVKKFIPGYLKLIIKSCLSDYLKDNLANKKEELQDQLRNLGTTSIVAADAQDYLRRLDELNSQMMSIPFTNVYHQDTFVLISDDTYSLWESSYQPALNLSDCQVYNYHSLEEFEFQTLTLTSWRMEEYQKNRKSFFRQQ